MRTEARTRTARRKASWCKAGAKTRASRRRLSVTGLPRKGISADSAPAGQGASCPADVNNDHDDREHFLILHDRRTGRLLRAATLILYIFLQSGGAYITQSAHAHAFPRLWRLYSSRPRCVSRFMTLLPLSNPRTVAIFHASFHRTQGNIIDWSLKASEGMTASGTT